ncbi:MULTISPECIES: hypothetical protein [Flavobacteriaceae]|uniref:Uncharacterized protein n=2 Tax=Flavobacteriaceae TaxID=49546 RepID=A0A4Y8AS13_9FLAO|nr:MULTISPECIES: hypothetical protein [Flavobacteriaceae]TEW73990.1 hypothetical protein E2488_10980 [Gramella jeungdoensis]GGK39359.1 hypothetical protein GCM10007963_04280 [Lutibacter litoralis]
MSFGGHVNDMVNKIKQNAALKNARRKKFKSGNDYSKIKIIKTTYNIPKLSKSDLNTFKQKIVKVAAKEKRKQQLYWILGAISVLISILIFNFVDF